MGLGSFLREALDVVLGPLSNLIGCFGGLIGGAITELRYLGSGGSRLSGQTKDIMREFFPTVNLGDVRLKTHASVPLGKGALTLDHRIYFAGGFDECDLQDMQKLMHELVHVRQFEAHGWAGFMCEYGRQWLDRGYELAWMELEAELFVNDNAARLETVVVSACGSTAVTPVSAKSSSDAFWLLWSGA